MLNRIVIIISIFALSGCMPVLFGIGAHAQIAATRNKSVTKATKDIAIANAIRKEYLLNGFKKLYASITIDAADGNVQLTGTVENEEDVITAVEIAWNQNGVKEVLNELTVDQNNPFFNLPQYTKDTWITAQIKTTILANKEARFANFTIVTYKNIVYIFGVADSQEQVELAANISASIRGVEQVISNVIIKE